MVDKQICQGVGVGLRPPHLHEVINTLPPLPWFEVHSCNFLGGGLNRELLQQVRQHYPLSFHGVNLNLGGIDPLNSQYLSQLKQAVDHFQPSLISDHVCFCAHQGRHFHDLLPIPYTEESAVHIAARIREVQDYLGQRILIENVSRYFNYEESQLHEGEYLAAVCELADCGLVLDLNNAYVNFRNHGDDIAHFIDALPLERVAEIHLAGHSIQDGMLIDTHNCEICPEVWDLYALYAKLLPEVPCLIEWDNDLPTLSVLMQEQAKAMTILYPPFQKRMTCR